MHDMRFLVFPTILVINLKMLGYPMPEGVAHAYYGIRVTCFSRLTVTAGQEEALVHALIGANPNVSID